MSCDYTKSTIPIIRHLLYSAVGQRVQMTISFSYHYKIEIPVYHPYIRYYYRIEIYIDINTPMKMQMIPVIEYDTRFCFRRVNRIECL